MTDDREKVTLYPLTLLIMLFTCMMIGVVLTWLTFAMTGSRATDCPAFSEAEEKVHRQASLRVMKTYPETKELALPEGSGQ